jgi:heme exporter protein C
LKTQIKDVGQLSRMLHSVNKLNSRSYLLVFAAMLMLADLYLIFMIAPTDSILGHVQRVFYFHVPIAVMSFLSFFVVFSASIAYLITRDRRWDSLAHAAAEVGVVFVTLALLTGVIWARPVWNTWWTWEPRLTTTLILWLIYVAYLMVRAYAPDQSRGAIYAAVVGIVGFIDVPIVYYSVQWWRSIHPGPVLGPWAEADALNGTIFATLMFSLLTFIVLLLYLILERKTLRDSEDQISYLKFTLRRRSSFHI